MLNKALDGWMEAGLRAARVGKGGVSFGGLPP